MSPETVQIQAEEEALSVVGRTREAFDAAMARVADLWRLTWEAQVALEAATESYRAAKAHFHAVSQRSEAL